MNKYCVIHRGTDFKVLYMDKESAGKWREEGWELRAFGSNEEAQSEMLRWKAGLSAPVAAPRASYPTMSSLVRSGRTASGNESQVSTTRANS